MLFAVVNAATMLTSLGAGRLSHRLGLGLVRALTAVRVAHRLGLALRQSDVMGAADPTERASVAALSLADPVDGWRSTDRRRALFDAGVLELPFLLAGGLQLVGTVLFYLFFRGRPPAGEGEAEVDQPVAAAVREPPGTVAMDKVRVGDCGNEFPIRGEP